MRRESHCWLFTNISPRWPLGSQYLLHRRRNKLCPVTSYAKLYVPLSPFKCYPPAIPAESRFIGRLCDQAKPLNYYGSNSPQFPTEKWEFHEILLRSDDRLSILFCMLAVNPNGFSSPPDTIISTSEFSLHYILHPSSRPSTNQPMHISKPELHQNYMVIIMEICVWSSSWIYFYSFLLSSHPGLLATAKSRNFF